MKLDRLLSITMALLGSRKRLTAEDLAERFEVSLRTVYRDIETLSQAGIPIISYPGPDGGYEIMPSYRLDKQMLTLEQLYSLYSAVRGIQTATDNPDLTGLLEKIRLSCPNTPHLLRLQGWTFNMLRSRMRERRSARSILLSASCVWPSSITWISAGRRRPGPLNRWDYT